MAINDQNKTKASAPHQSPFLLQGHHSKCLNILHLCFVYFSLPRPPLLVNTNYLISIFNLFSFLGVCVTKKGQKETSELWTAG